MQRVLQVMKVAGPLLLIGLIVPGGCLVVLTLLFKGGAAAELLPAKFAVLAPVLKAFQIR